MVFCVWGKRFSKYKKIYKTRVTILKTYMVLISTVHVMFSQLVQSNALCPVNEELKATVLLST